MSTLGMRIFVFLVFLQVVLGDEHTYKYIDNEQVVLWMNTVGPYNNLQETYSYFDLPFCRGPVTGIEHYHETLAEALQGIQLEFSGLEIRFKRVVEKTQYCQQLLGMDDVELFIYAIKKNYWYQLYLDDLPITGLLGETRKDDSKYYLWTHMHLDIAYNDDQIVAVTLTSSNPVLLNTNLQIGFTYSVNWTSSSIEFANRFDHYLDTNFFQHKIHWFSILNSFMMVIFLVALVSMILMRTLRKDYARYNKEGHFDDLERELGDEYGWKQVHGDVFRPPAGLLYFASLVGTGSHVAVVTILVTIFAFLGRVYKERGGFLSNVIFLYVVLAPVNGFIGGRIYSHMGGKRWIRQLMAGAMLLPVMVCSVALGVDVVAMFYQTSREIAFLSMLSVFAIILFAILPLNLIGTVLGRNLGSAPSQPCRVNTVPHPIPETSCLLKPHFIILIGGILPFGSIFIEMYFIFTSFWASKIYYVFGFTLLVTLILIIVTSCTTIVCTYFLLNSEDYRWQWISFASGASTAIYVYIYSIYYFLFKTKMSGLFQTTFYFGYMSLFCIALGTMCGAVGYLSSSRFVRKIYSSVKID